MPLFRQEIADVKSAQKPHIGPLVGGKIAKRSRVVAAMRAQDKPAALGRRVVAAQSVAGDVAWIVVDTAPSLVASDHPFYNVARAVLRAVCLVTPGHVLQGSVLYIGSGQTQIFNGAGQYLVGGKTGALQVQVDWTAEDASTASTQRAANLTGVGDPDGAAPADPWSAIKLATISDIHPPSFAANVDVQTWTQHTGAAITMSHVGGARVLDAVLHELPDVLVREDDDADDQFVSHMLGTPTPDSPGPSMTHPLEEIATDNTRGGTWRMLDVPQAQRLRLGPHLVSWTAYAESNTTHAETEILPVQTTSATFERLWDGAATGYDEDEPGWSIASAAYARNNAECHEYAMDNVGTVPVLVAVYGGGAGTGDTGTVRIQASAWSWIDVDLTDTVGWHYAYGHLRCGMGPGDTSVLQAFFRRTAGTGSADVYSLSIFACGQIDPNL